MPAQKIGTLLTTSGDLKALSEKARRVLQLQQVFFASAPPSLAQASRVGNYRAGTLFLLADNAAVAAKLRQLAPRLLLNIRKQEPQVTGIQVAVQVTKSRAGPGTRPAKGRLSTDSIGHFSKLSERMPDSPLKTALTNLVRRRSRSG
jgi:hypothetical protein